MRLKEAAMKAWKITVRLSATLVLICCLAFGTQSAKAQTYTSDHDITHFTSGIVSYATFSQYSSIQGCDAGSTFTPTSSELTTTGCRVFGGTLTGTGLSGSNNWIEAAFSSPVSTIMVFPNIDHFGSAYDGFQYTIAGSNDGLNWTVLFDPTSVSGAGEPFTLGASTGTAPTSVNNVLTPQSVGLAPSCSGTSTPCAIGYIATYNFSTGYQFYAFGASTEAVNAGNADQELSAVGAGQTLTQPVSTQSPTTFNFTANNNVLTHTDNFAVEGIQLTFPLGDQNTLQIQSSNNPIDAVTWPQYVVGGPLAPSALFPLAANNPAAGGTNGGLFVDLCFDPTKPGTGATPSDANCPFVDPNNTTSPLLDINVVADIVNPKPNITPGTTSVLAHFEQKTTTQATWSPSTTSPNPACANTTGPNHVTQPTQPAPPTNCDVLDIEQSIAGDQTTSSGRSRGKGTFAFAYGVPMLLSTVSANGKPLNTPPMFTNPYVPLSAGLWFSASNGLNLNFLVNPACLPSTTACTSTPTLANNFFSPAPVAGENFDIKDVHGNPVVPSTPGTLAAATPPPGFDTSIVQPVNFTANPTLADGQYILEWTAFDNVNILEQNQKLVAASTLADPSHCPDGTTVPVGGFCYVTSLFSTPLNIDSTPPTISAITFSPSSNGNIFAVNQPVTVTFTCADPVVNSVSSGLATCISSGGQPNGGGPLNTSKAGTFTYTVTATDVAGNQTKQSVQYQIVGSSQLVLLNFAKPTVKLGSNLTYNIAILNFGPAVADNLVVTDTLPAGTSFVSAGYGIVSCMPSGCSDMNGPGTACSISGNTVTCNIPTLGLLFNSFTGALVKITVNVNNATPGTVLKDTASVKAVNTDPFPGASSATASTEVCTSTGSCPKLH